MRPIPFRLPSAKAALFFAALAGSMFFFNFALPQREPASFAVLYAALACGRNPVAASAAYLAGVVMKDCQKPRKETNY